MISDHSLDTVVSVKPQHHRYRRFKESGWFCKRRQVEEAAPCRCCLLPLLPFIWNTNPLGRKKLRIETKQTNINLFHYRPTAGSEEEAILKWDLAPHVWQERQTRRGFKKTKKLPERVSVGASLTTRWIEFTEKCSHISLVSQQQDFFFCCGQSGVCDSADH